jgi:hypothetical protein
MIRYIMFRPSHADEQTTPIHVSMKIENYREFQSIFTYDILDWLKW